MFLIIPIPTTNSKTLSLVQVPSPEMGNKTLTGTLESLSDSVKECKGWFNKNLPWEEIKDGQNSGVSCSLAKLKG